jgi:hypothetical protein
VVVCSALGNTGAGGIGAVGTDAVGARDASGVGAGWEWCYPFMGCARSGGAQH